MYNESTEDVINHPPHYETNGIECFDAILASQGKNFAMAFCICNAQKYIWRHQHKNGVDDIKKAKWYIDKYIELFETPEDETFSYIKITEGKINDNLD